MARVRGRFALLGVLALLGLAGLLLYGTYGRRGADVQKAGGGPARPSIYAAEPGVDESAPRGAIAGRVTGPAGAPIAGATVVLTRAQDCRTTSFGEFGRPLSVVRSDAAGRFRLESVHAGSYTVGAMAPGHAPAQKSPIPVSAGQTAEVALELGAGGFLLSGRVSRHRRRRGPRGHGAGGRHPPVPGGAAPSPRSPPPPTSRGPTSSIFRAGNTA